MLLLLALPLPLLAMLLDACLVPVVAAVVPTFLPVVPLLELPLVTMPPVLCIAPLNDNLPPPAIVKLVKGGLLVPVGVADMMVVATVAA